MKRYKKKKSSFRHSLTYALTGIGHAFSTQRNMKIHFLVATLVCILGISLSISRLEWLALIFVTGLVISLEMMNTSVELVVDLSTNQQKIRAKLAKDVAAGSVLIASILALICGCLIFYPRFVNLMSGGT